MVTSLVDCGLTAFDRSDECGTGGEEVWHAKRCGNGGGWESVGGFAALGLTDSTEELHGEAGEGGRREGKRRSCRRLGVQGCVRVCVGVRGTRKRLLLDLHYSAPHADSLPICSDALVMPFVSHLRDCASVGGAAHGRRVQATRPCYWLQRTLEHPHLQHKEQERREKRKREKEKKREE